MLEILQLSVFNSLDSTYYRYKKNARLMVRFVVRKYNRFYYILLLDAILYR